MRIILIFAILIAFYWNISGQEASESNSQYITPQELVRPFTQEDLNTLVGNVQRPNGIIWFQNTLYAACNGDFTLYEINADTGSTKTFVFGVRDTHTLYARETETGFELWLPDFVTNSIIRLNETRSAPTIITRDIETPWGISPISKIEDRQAFLVTSLRANSIVYTDETGVQTTILEGLRSPTGIVVDGDIGYVVNNGSARRAIEWFEITIDEETSEITTSEPKALVSGLQNASNLVLAADKLLYFTYALGNRGVIGRIDPEICKDEGCTNDQIEIVIFTELPAPLAGLTISPDMRLFVHAIYRPEIYWVNIYQSAD